MEKNNGYRIAGFILGLMSVLSGGLILAILGLVFSSKCRKALKEANETDGLVTAGFILSIIGIIKTIFVTIFVFFAIILSFYAESNVNLRKTPYYYNNNYYDDYYYDDYYDDYALEDADDDYYYSYIFKNNNDNEKKYVEKVEEKVNQLDSKLDEIGENLDEYFENYFDNLESILDSYNI